MAASVGGTPPSLVTLRVGVRLTASRLPLARTVSGWRAVVRVGVWAGVVSPLWVMAWWRDGWSGGASSVWGVGRSPVAPRGTDGLCHAACGCTGTVSCVWLVVRFVCGACVAGSPSSASPLVERSQKVAELLVRAADV